MDCPACGAQNSDSATFCSLCLFVFPSLGDDPALTPADATQAAPPEHPAGLCGRWHVLGDPLPYYEFGSDGRVWVKSSPAGSWGSSGPGLISIVTPTGARIDSRYELLGDSLRLYANLTADDFQELERRR